MAKLTEEQKRKNFEATVGSSENDMGPLPSKTVKPPVKMPELKTKDTGDKNEVDIKGVLPKGYENAKPVKKGGVIKDLKKAGFYDAKEDKAKRLNIINKVTTKPERIEMVDKMFSAKKMAKGGTASSRADGCAVRGKTRA